MTDFIYIIPTDNNTRRTLYNVNSIPQAYMDGGNRNSAAIYSRDTFS